MFSNLATFEVSSANAVKLDKPNILVVVKKKKAFENMVGKGKKLVT